MSPDTVLHEPLISLALISPLTLLTSQLTLPPISMLPDVFETLPVTFPVTLMGPHVELTLSGFPVTLIPTLNTGRDNEDANEKLSLIDAIHDDSVVANHYIGSRVRLSVDGEHTLSTCHNHAVVVGHVVECPTSYRRIANHSRPVVEVDRHSIDKGLCVCVCVHVEFKKVPFCQIDYDEFQKKIFFFLWML